VDDKPQTMRLYFVRHGIAYREFFPGIDPPSPLTLRGKKQVRQAAHVMKAMKICPQRIFSSTVLRARQTAEIFGEVLGVNAELSEDIYLFMSLSTVEKLIQNLGSETEVMFVGHEPKLSETISALIGGGSIKMKKGSVARVDITDRQPLRGTLVWLLAPRMLRAMD